MSQARFQKQQRERTRKEKAAAKGARRAERTERPDEALVAPTAVDEGLILSELAQLHDRFEAGAVTFEDFEEEKDQLMERLHVR